METNKQFNLSEITFTNKIFKIVMVFFLSIVGGMIIILLFNSIKLSNLFLTQVYLYIFLFTISVFIAETSPLLMKRILIIFPFLNEYKGRASLLLIISLPMLFSGQFLAILCGIIYFLCFLIELIRYFILSNQYAQSEKVEEIEEIK